MSLIITNKATVKAEDFFEQDIWKIKELYLSHFINFTDITPIWLKEVTKKFIYLHLAIRTVNTCKGYLLAVKQFSNFIKNLDKPVFPQSINRKLIIKYLEHIGTTKLSNSSKFSALINLRTFIETVAREEWLPFTKERIIYHDEIPTIAASIPRFIPEVVMKQLERSLIALPEYHRRLIIVLKETGRRISEVCSLSFDCLKRDNESAPFLEVHDKKLKKNYLIPISRECETTILEQQAWLVERDLARIGFLFVSFKWKNKLGPAKTRMIHMILNDLAEKRNIINEDGTIWHFSSHQFRHTVGTRMINANVPQPIIQRYLGHESPEMTNRYAHIYDKTMKKAFNVFQDKLVNIKGEIISDQYEQISEKDWLKHNIMFQTLPNGYCRLPAGLKECPHANSCLTCGNFRTNKDFIDQHENQLKNTNKILEIAEHNNWQRQIEINTIIKSNLEVIIKSLKGHSNE